MKNSCRLLSVLAIAALFLASIATFAQPSTQTTTEKPQLIVWAHTNIENQGAPTLDILDLERYFVKTLAEHHVDVVASSMTTIPRPPAPNIYLLELSVDATRLSERPRWGGRSKTVFGVDLSLVAKDLGSGKELGQVLKRLERDIDESYDDLPQKRAAIYKASDDVAGSFLAAWAGGEFGQALPKSQAPTFIQRTPRWLLYTSLVVIGIAVIYVIILVAYFFYLAVRAVVRLCARLLKSKPRERTRPQPKPQLALQPQPPLQPQPKPEPPPQPKQPDYQAWDGELLAAFALALKTEDFSEAACKATAADNREALLASHAEIEAREAKRILSAKRHEEHYGELADYAVAHSGLDKAQIVETLRQADIWEYRVLQETKRQALEVSR